VTAIFEMSVETEMLSAEEITQITGCSRRAEQLEWLAAQDWLHHKNRAGIPIVGRLYARMRLSGVHMQNAAFGSVGGSWTPDFTSLSIQTRTGHAAANASRSLAN
jgi:Domain of unknown function (DUF4224)